MNKQYSLMLVFILLVLGGCTTNTISKVDTYMISVTCKTDTSSEQRAKFSKILRISKPKSNTAIMSRNILYQEKEFAQAPYAYSRWNDTPNIMLGNLFIACVNKNSIFKAVLPSYSKGKADFLLESTLSEFSHRINSDGSSEGRVKVKFYLIESKNDNVVATTEFFSKASSETLDAEGGVKALNTASQSVALKLIQWLMSLDELNNNLQDTK